MRLAALAMLAACGSPSAPGDAASTDIDYILSAGAPTPRRDPAPTIWIDGAQTMSLEVMYPASLANTVVHHTVELRYQDTVLVHRDVGDTLSPCQADAGQVYSYQTGFLVLDSGDLRYGPTKILSHKDAMIDVVCNGDSFAMPDCSCNAGERCEPRVELDTPPFTRLACAPIGPKLHGDTCTFTPDTSGAYDDCGDHLFCYQGTCHSLCIGQLGGTALSDEYPPDLQLCDP